MSNNNHKRKRSDNDSNSGSSSSSVSNEYVDDYSPKRVRHHYVQGLYVCDDALGLFSDAEIVRYARVAHRWFARQRAADLTRRTACSSPSSPSQSSASTADSIVDDRSPDRSPSHSDSDSNGSDKENGGLSSRLHGTHLSTPPNNPNTPQHDHTSSSALSSSAASSSSSPKKRARGADDDRSEQKQRKGSKFRR